MKTGWSEEKYGHCFGVVFLFGPSPEWPMERHLRILIGCGKRDFQIIWNPRSNELVRASKIKQRLLQESEP